MVRYLFPFLLLLGCPLMMVYMMRGGRSGKANDQAGDRQAPTSAPTPQQPDPRDDRLAELEREVAELRASRETTDTSRP